MVRRTRQESQKITREKLKQAALEAFASHGVRGSSIENITLAAGYSRGAFYANYKNKLELLADVLRDKQISEVRYWRKVMEESQDPEVSLHTLVERFENLPQAKHRRLLSMELLLEACRNEKFEPIFKKYLDETHRELRGFLEALLKSYGKALPENIDSLVVSNRLIALGLGTRASLGNEIGARVSPSEVMLDFLHNIIESAPALKKTGASTNKSKSA